MNTFVDSEGIRHALTHVNKEKLAARTACGRYSDFKPGHIAGDAPITCIPCLTAPLLTYYENRQAKTQVTARRGDAMRRCRQTGKHMVNKHADGSCRACGYIKTEETHEQTIHPSRVHP